MPLPINLLAIVCGFTGSIGLAWFTVVVSSTNDDDRVNVENLPVVVTTWSADCFQKATEAAWQSFISTSNRLQAITDGCTLCEQLQCDGSVGYGGSPDELGHSSLDALLIDGPQHRVGAVAQLRKIKTASKVAWAVMNYTKHSLLVGEMADRFALEMGFNESQLETNESVLLWKNWMANKCQPNFRQNVSPDPTKNCGPYLPIPFADNRLDKSFKRVDFSKTNRFQHDTVGIVLVDKNGDISAGTSTNGATHKIPGRVSDSAVVGAGAYVDNDVGGSASTGDGDVMMRFLPSFRTVENMRHGMTPNEAASDSIRQIAKFYPSFKGAVTAVNKSGQFGAACHGIGSFTYSVRNGLMDRVQLVTVNCVDN